MHFFAYAIALSAAAAPVAAEEFSLSTTVGFESRYIFRGVQYQEASFQPAINLSYGNFYGGAWLALPVGDDDIAFGDELDLFAGYSASITDAVSFDVGLTYYTYPDTMSGFFDDSTNTLEAYGGLSLSAPLSPSAYIYRDFTVDVTTIQGGLSHSFPLSEKTSFDLEGAIGYVIPDSGIEYLYGTAMANLTFAFSDDASVYAGARYGGSDLPGGSLYADTTLPTLTTKASGFWFGLGFTTGF